MSDISPIATSLGSCISVILYSKEKQLGGMNHFMIAEPGHRAPEVSSTGGRYGVHAMELLINSLIKKGVYKSDMKAAVFGGGKMFDREHYNAPGSHIGANNADFAIKFLDAERIPVIARETGGSGGRRVTFFPDTGKIQVKRIKAIFNLTEAEKEYIQDLKQQRADAAANIKLF